MVIIYASFGSLKTQLSQMLVGLFLAIFGCVFSLLSTGLYRRTEADNADENVHPL